MRRKGKQEICRTSTASIHLVCCCRRIFSCHGLQLITFFFFQLDVASSALCEGGCQFPMCPDHVTSPIVAAEAGAAAEGHKRRRHTQEECQALARLHPEDLSEYIYEIILPLRALLLKQGENKSAFNVIDTFMDHKEEREADGEYWQRSLKVVIGPLQRIFPEVIKFSPF